MTTRIRPALLLLLLMVLACVLMTAVLLRMRQRAHAHPQSPLTSTVPLSQTPDEPQVHVTLLMPNDKTGQLSSVSRILALPQDESSRARALVEQLIASWRAPGSLHLVHSPAGVDSVFLLPVSLHPNQQLAVVNLNAAFPQAQPSGIEPESLTLLSIIQTLHANLPSITRVRFLVHGETRPTLAGHADLTRTYLAQSDLAHPTPPGPKS